MDRPPHILNASSIPPGIALPIVDKALLAGPAAPFATIFMLALNSPV